MYGLTYSLYQRRGIREIIYTNKREILCVCLSEDPNKVVSDVSETLYIYMCTLLNSHWLPGLSELEFELEHWESCVVKCSHEPLQPMFVSSSHGPWSKHHELSILWWISASSNHYTFVLQQTQRVRSTVVQRVTHMRVYAGSSPTSTDHRKELI